MRLRVALVAILALAAFLWWTDRPVPREPGVLAPEPPLQVELPEEEFFPHDDFVIAKVARFEVAARVLGKERYWVEREADLVPYDLALGWGRMSDSTVLEKISISQGRRYYFWSVREYPIPRSEIISSSANMHLIPSTKEVRDAIGSVREGQVVRFTGYLVRAIGPNGWRWTTSLTRTDTGNGACELVWVETFEVVS